MASKEWDVTELLCGDYLSQELPEAPSDFENWYLLLNGSNKVSQQIYPPGIPVFLIACWGGLPRPILVCWNSGYLFALAADDARAFLDGLQSTTFAWCWTWDLHNDRGTEESCWSLIAWSLSWCKPYHLCNLCFSPYPDCSCGPPM